MRRVREILRVKFECGASDRAIAVAVGVARSTVQLCVSRLIAAGLTWPLPATLTERGPEAWLDPARPVIATTSQPRVAPFGTSRPSMPSLW
jgi:hypothetical protein